MGIRICAVGRLKQGPEKTLVDDYVTRFNRTGRPIGLGPVDVTEVDDRKARDPSEEAVLLRAAVPTGAVVATLDERGKTLTSPQFARQLARWRDDARDVAFVIGGADGIDPALRAEAGFSLSLGAMVWPHMLARVMLAEQLYRAATILAGSPYHRA
jgi:23S rRNA (pseudouridine1915-N3)-methyltransferase